MSSVRSSLLSSIDENFVSNSCLIELISSVISLQLAGPGPSSIFLRFELLEVAKSSSESVAGVGSIRDRPLMDMDFGTGTA